jgi:predicted enzyme related to lactoylglutathione lyase
MPVELGYFTLKVKDVARAKAFYGALFDWQIEGSGHVANTRFPLGISDGGPAELPFVYFRTPDLEALLHRLVALGGAVRERGHPASGANALCSDDQGTVFSLWQPAPGYE